ncbi:MAG: GspE/PulE family protein [Acetobacteraceae bacterium]
MPDTPAWPQGKVSGTAGGVVTPMDQLVARLAESGQCDRAGLERARLVAAETGQRLDHVLKHLGLVTERDLAEAYAALAGVRLAAADRYPAEAVFPERVQARFLRAAGALPLRLESGALVLAMTDPFDQFTARAVAAATGQRVAIEVAVPIELEAAIERLYPETGREEAAPLAAEAAAFEEDTERLRDLASEAPVIRLVNQIISRAVEARASDIHIEPCEDRLRIRYRRDGILAEVESPPMRLAPAIISRIKIMARLDIAERRLPQDGRVRLAIRGQEVDFRVSSVPALHGETMVLRVLDRSAVEFDYARLGLSPAVVARLEATFALPNGMVLVTGPTGSGKTTTLYTGLLGLNSGARNIVTIEDPIEFQLPGVNQIQVKPQIGLDFAHLLRAILRQDPDVIMVGEIRDLETAEIAAQAALTGHLVLSTLHTNSAAASITRLRDMGVEDYLITAVLRGVLAQRLVRRLCPECRRAQPAPPGLAVRLGIGRDGGEAQLWHAVGCPACRGSGYQGRMAVAEFLVPDAAIEGQIFARSDEAGIERAAIAGGMIPMFRAGLAAVLAGETTLEELARSIRATY